MLGDDAWKCYGSFVQTKHLSVLIHIRIKGEVSTVKHVSALPSSIVFTDRSETVLLLWIISLGMFHVLCCLVCSLQPCYHLLMCNVFLCFCHFLIWCPGSCVVPYFGRICISLIIYEFAYHSLPKRQNASEYKQELQSHITVQPLEP